MKQSFAITQQQLAVIQPLVLTVISSYLTVCVIPLMSLAQCRSMSIPDTVSFGLHQ